jgi:hypothetical protein
MKRRGVLDVLSKFSSNPLISFMSMCHSSVIETGKLKDKRTGADPDSHSFMVLLWCQATCICFHFRFSLIAEFLFCDSTNISPLVY